MSKEDLKATNGIQRGIAGAAGAQPPGGPGAALSSTRVTATQLERVASPPGSLDLEMLEGERVTGMNRED